MFHVRISHATAPVPLPDPDGTIGFAAGRFPREQITGELKILRVAASGGLSAVGLSRCLCVVAVPTTLTASDFCTWVGPFGDKIEHMRVLRSLPAGLERYIVLINFRTQEAADRFFRGFNGRPFSSFAPELCRVVYVGAVVINPLSGSIAGGSDEETADDHRAKQPFLSSDPLLTLSNAAAVGLTGGGSEHPPDATAVLPLAPSSVELCAPLAVQARLGASNTPHHQQGSVHGTTSFTINASEIVERDEAAALVVPLVEVPSCPICLERLDSSASGMLTTICDHTFHCTCLARWSNLNCPVCRYTLAAESASSASAAACCEQCGTAGENWICLICGHVGCGRAVRGHALAHFSETGHSYTLELSTQRVWDYVMDSYVHRLIAVQQQQQQQFNGRSSGRRRRSTSRARNAGSPPSAEASASGESSNDGTALVAMQSDPGRSSSRSGAGGGWHHHPNGDNDRDPSSSGSSNGRGPIQRRLVELPDAHGGREQHARSPGSHDAAAAASHRRRDLLYSCACGGGSTNRGKVGSSSAAAAAAPETAAAADAAAAASGASAPEPLESRHPDDADSEEEDTDVFFDEGGIAYCSACGSSLIEVEAADLSPSTSPSCRRGGGGGWPSRASYSQRTRGSGKAAAGAHDDDGDNNGGYACYGDNEKDNEKAEGMAFEYTMLLSHQLEVQRGYYEGLLAQLYSLVAQRNFNLHPHALPSLPPPPTAPHVESVSTSSSSSSSSCGNINGKAVELGSTLIDGGIARNASSANGSSGTITSNGGLTSIATLRRSPPHTAVTGTTAAAAAAVGVDIPTGDGSVPVQQLFAYLEVLRAAAEDIVFGHGRGHRFNLPSSNSPGDHTAPAPAAASVGGPLASSRGSATGGFVGEDDVGASERAFRAASAAFQLGASFPGPDDVAADAADEGALRLPPPALKDGTRHTSPRMRPHSSNSPVLAAATTTAASALASVSSRGSAEPIIFAQRPSSSSSPLLPPPVSPRATSAGRSSVIASSRNAGSAAAAMTADPATAAATATWPCPALACRAREVEVVGLRGRLAEATARAAAAERTRRSLVRSAEEARSATALAQEELAFLRDVNETLSANSKEWETRCRDAIARGVRAEGEARATIAGLQEEARDLMFALESGERLKRATPAHREEMAGGTIVVPEAAAAAAASVAESGVRRKKKAGGRG